MSNRYQLVAVGLAAAATVSMAGPAAAQLQEVAVRGGAAPEPGSTYRSFNRPDASDVATARVVFEAKLRGAGGSQQGLFYDDPVAAGSTIVLRRQLAPNGQQFTRVRKRPAVNAVGEVAWSGDQTGQFRGIFQQGPANVVLVGDAVPAPANGSLETFGRPERADNGAVAFYATISGGSLVNGVIADEGIFRCNGGDFDCTSGSGILETVVLKTDAVPDRPGRFFCSLGNTVGASSVGVAFRASTQLDCSDLLEVPLEGVFRSTGGTIETVALQGEQAQPFLVVGGTTYGFFRSTPSMANDGTVAFSAETAGVAEMVAIYRCDTGLCPTLPADSIVLAGNVDGAGNTVSTFFTAIGVSDALDVVFHTRVTDLAGRRARGIYVYRDATGSLERIAAKEDPAPGAVASEFRRVLPPDISSGGRIVFNAKTRRLMGGGTKGVYLFE